MKNIASQITLTYADAVRAITTARAIQNQNAKVFLEMEGKDQMAVCKANMDRDVTLFDEWRKRSLSGDVVADIPKSSIAAFLSGTAVSLLPLW